MIKVIDFRNVEIDGNNVGDLVSAIANNLESPRLSEIITALEEYKKSYKSTAAIDQSEATRKQAEIEIESIRAELTAKDATIAQLRTQLSPDIASILDALLAAGLKAWGAAAITAANDEDGVFDMVLQLQDVARESPSWSQCDLIKQLFDLACYHSKIVPTAEQATCMQGVLDAGGSTGPIGEQWLSFRQWM
jgi:hypothetical protein